MEAEIPRAARAFRPGVRLNYAGDTGAQLQIASLRVWKRTPQDPTIDGVFPMDAQPRLSVASPLVAYSPGSIAARTSNHWLSYQLALHLSGVRELTKAAQAKPIPIHILPSQPGHDNIPAVSE